MRVQYGIEELAGVMRRVDTSGDEPTQYFQFYFNRSNIVPRKMEFLAGSQPIPLGERALRVKVPFYPQ